MKLDQGMEQWHTDVSRHFDPNQQRNQNASYWKGGITKAKIELPNVFSFQRRFIQRPKVSQHFEIGAKFFGVAWKSTINWSRFNLGNFGSSSSSPPRLPLPPTSSLSPSSVSNGIHEGERENASWTEIMPFLLTCDNAEGTASMTAFTLASGLPGSWWRIMTAVPNPYLWCLWYGSCGFSTSVWLRDRNRTMSVIRIVATADAKKGDTVCMFGWSGWNAYTGGLGYTLNEDGEVLLNIWDGIRFPQSVPCQS